MKEPNLSLLATDLLSTACALAGILDQQVENDSIRVNFAYAAELIRNVQVSATIVAEELLGPIGRE